MRILNLTEGQAPPRWNMRACLVSPHRDSAYVSTLSQNGNNLTKWLGAVPVPDDAFRDLLSRAFDKLRPHFPCTCNDTEVGAKPRHAAASLVEAITTRLFGPKIPGARECPASPQSVTSSQPLFSRALLLRWKIVLHSNSLTGNLIPPLRCLHAHPAMPAHACAAPSLPRLYIATLHL